MMRGLTLGCVALAACTLEAGQGFATLESTRLELELDPASTRVDGETVLTDLEYRVHFEAFEIDVSEIELQQLEGGVGSGEPFDPANPPPGYSLCHGGHCHADDGSLVSYEEIQARLSGGSVRYVPLATVPVGETLDVLSGDVAMPSGAEPSPELPRGTLSRIHVGVERMRLEGQATGGELGDGSVAVSLDVPVSGGFVATVSRPLDRDHPPGLRLSVSVPIAGTFLDGVRFGTDSPEPDVVAGSVLGNDIHVSFEQ